MCVERRRLRRVYRHLGGRAAIGHVYRPRAVLPSQAGVPSQQFPARLFLGFPPLPPPATAIASADDGDEERECSYELGCPGALGEARADEGQVVVIEDKKRVFAVAKRGLSCHPLRMVSVEEMLWMVLWRKMSGEVQRDLHVRRWSSVSPRGPPPCESERPRSIDDAPCAPRPPHLRRRIWGSTSTDHCIFFATGHSRSSRELNHHALVKRTVQHYHLPSIVLYNPLSVTIPNLLRSLQPPPTRSFLAAY